MIVDPAGVPPVVRVSATRRGVLAEYVVAYPMTSTMTPVVSDV